MKKLTEAQVIELQGLKGTRGGSDKFFDIIEGIYADDNETLAEIEKCRSMKDSLDWIESFPAHEKSTQMFYHFMDDLLLKIGYKKPAE